MSLKFLSLGIPEVMSLKKLKKCRQKNKSFEHILFDSLYFIFQLFIPIDLIDIKKLQHLDLFYLIFCQKKSKSQKLQSSAIPKIEYLFNLCDAVARFIQVCVFLRHVSNCMKIKIKNYHQKI